MIQHLRHSEVVKDQWDELLARCPDRIWYMQSWVLDLVCPRWEALIDRERGAIMPLLWKSKFGMDYLYQPYTLQQQGLFAPRMASDLTDAFLQAVPARFRYWDIHVQTSMQVVGTDALQVRPNSNQTLPLNDSLEIIRAGYSQGHRRNLRKTTPPPEIREDLSVHDFVALFQRTTAARFGGVPEGGLDLLTRLMTGALERGQCRIHSVMLGGKAVAATCCMIHANRCILLKSANDEAGQAGQAMFHIVDRIIADHAGTDMLLDFAGSNTESVARFNTGFGASSSVYLHLKRNRLPIPLRWMKR